MIYVQTTVYGGGLYQLFENSAPEWVDKHF